MDYRIWVDLFGRTAEDPQLKALLVKAGITKRLVMPKDDLEIEEEIPGMNLVFSHEALFRNLPPVGEGNCVLTKVIMYFDNDPDVYTGPMPFGIKPTDTQSDLRAKFGEPLTEDAKRGWERWSVEGNLWLTVSYLKDGAKLEAIALSLPDPEGE